MKQILTIFTIVAVFLAACNNNKNNEAAISALQAYKDSIRLSSDTAGLAQYRMWKMQNELSNPNEYNPYASGNTAPENSVVRERIIYKEPARSNSRSYASTESRRSSRSRSGNSGVYDGGSMTSESGHTAERATKKGWSKAAKGTAIGAGGGAVLGAIINKKNPVVGGVIGGVLGGGVGYGIGRSMDKKDGRY